MDLKYWENVLLININNIGNIVGFVIGGEVIWLEKYEKFWLGLLIDVYILESFVLEVIWVFFI